MNLAYDTAKLLRSSPAMQELQPMDEGYARAWVRYWKSEGFIPS